MAGILPAADFLYGDGGAKADLHSCRAMSGDEEEFSCGALFFIPFRRVTRLTLRGFISAVFEFKRVKDAIDAIASDLSEEFYLPLSTAYSWLTLVRQWCVFNSEGLGLNPNLKCLCDLRCAEPRLVLKVFDLDFPRVNKPP